jgi:ribosomal protein S18 acetylase RimI-like enzyme
MSTKNADEKQQVLDLQEEWINSGILPEEYNRIYEEMITEDNTIIVEQNGKVIGYSVFFEKKDNYQIDSAYLSPDFRKKGIGKELIEFTENVIKTQGGKTIEICPMTTNDEEKLFDYYIRLGYTRFNDIMKKDI